MELRSFLGLWNVYRRFVPKFASVAAPLNALLKKGESPKLGPLAEEQHRSFNALREKLLHPPVLALPRREDRYILDTDASNGQIGCCLLQEQADALKLPIGYWSLSLTSAERNYLTAERQCLAIVWTILKLRPYCEGYSGLVPRRYCKETLLRVQRLIESRGLQYGCFINNGTLRSRYCRIIPGWNPVSLPVLFAPQQRVRYLINFDV
jgi:hypothetical protein